VNTYQVAWAFYIAGGLGCGFAAWFMFRRFGRVWGHFFMVTVWALLLTPYAMDAEHMVMAPALFILVMESLINGFDTVKSIAVLLAGVWLVALVLSLIYQLLTRRFIRDPEPEPDYHDEDDEPQPRRVRRQPRDYHPDMSREESRARHDLLKGEVPMRAER